MPMPVKIRDTEIPGVQELHVPLFHDARGFFTEVYNRDMWKPAGFSHTFVQDCLSLSCKGTLRGMHYQLEPRAMGKLVRVIRGGVFDVAVDLRQGSPDFGRWVGRELRPDAGVMLWIPPGFAHGFVALEDETLVYYKCTDTHCPEAERAFALCGSGGGHRMAAGAHRGDGERPAGAFARGGGIQLPLILHPDWGLEGVLHV